MAREMAAQPETVDRVTLPDLLGRIKLAFLAAYGPERGAEASAEAALWATEHLDRLQQMKNPAGYLWRVGVSRTRPRLRVGLPAVTTEEPSFEPKLPASLQSLSRHQRVAVVLVHGYGWTLQEVARVTGRSVASTQRDVTRGLTGLRHALGVNDES
jgi:DNA-directed RNA polymerase specialized sigma24 family protein